MKALALAPLALLSACASVPPPATQGDLVLHYLRTNRDGSAPEHVLHFRPTPHTIAVYKWVSKCTTAAYVTATMDDAIVEGREFVAGKVAKDGSQARFGTLTVDENGPALVATVTPAGGDPIDARHPLKGRPFLLFDFDFADLNSFLQSRRPRGGFAFELPVVWPGPEGLFRDLGRMTAKPFGEESRGGRRVFRYALSIEGPTPSTGTLLVDAARFHIVEAELGLPNHQEYRDFRLVLEREERGGQAAFDAQTRSQYASCPA